MYVSQQVCSPQLSSRANNDNHTVVYAYCRNGHLKVVQYLINEQHCDANVSDKYGRTPLYLALRLAISNSNRA